MDDECIDVLLQYVLRKDNKDKYNYIPSFKQSFYHQQSKKYGFYPLCIYFIVKIILMIGFPIL